MPGRGNCIKNDLDNDVRKILMSDTKIEGWGIENIIIHQT